MKKSDFSIYHACVFGLVCEFGAKILKLELNKNTAFSVTSHLLLQPRPA